VVSLSGHSWPDIPTKQNPYSTVPITAWKTVVSLSATEKAVLGICIPVYTSYQNAGISESKDYAVLPELLWELGNSAPGHVRDSKLLILKSMTDNFIVTNQEAILSIKGPVDIKTRSSGAVKTAADIMADKGQVVKAITATTRFRLEYPLGSIQSNTSVSGESQVVDEYSTSIVDQTSVSPIADAAMVNEGTVAGQGKYVSKSTAKARLPKISAPTAMRPGRQRTKTESKRVAQIKGELTYNDEDTCSINIFP
jgi:hypothetical protein